MEPLNWFEILMLFGAFQGIMLIVAINQALKRHKTANQILTVFLAFIIFNSSWEVWKTSKDMILMDGIRNIIFFLYGPFYYLYTRALLTTETINRKTWIIHLIPALVYGVLLLFMLNVSKFWYSSWILTVILVLIHGLVYLRKSYHLINKYRKKTLNGSSYLKYLQNITLLAGGLLVVALCTLFIFISDLIYYVNLFNHYITGLIGSFVIYSLAYFGMQFPEVFKLPIKEIISAPIPLPSSSTPPPKQYLNEEELHACKIRLQETMIADKLYLNPCLTLDDIAKAIEVDKVMASRVINEGFQQNFYDFVNTYRIEHFIQLSQDKQYAHYTKLALAYEAGFNAKSTFHKVFKKIKDMTPTAYLKLMSDNHQ